MGVKLVLVILLILVQAIFAGLNMKNVSDISVGFKIFKEVPVFITIAISFVAGAIVAIPLAFIAACDRKKIGKSKVIIKAEIKEAKKQKKVDAKNKKISVEKSSTVINKYNENTN